MAVFFARPSEFSMPAHFHATRTSPPMAVNKRGAFSVSNRLYDRSRNV